MELARLGSGRERDVLDLGWGDQVRGIGVGDGLWVIRAQPFSGISVIPNVAGEGPLEGFGESPCCEPTVKAGVNLGGKILPPQDLPEPGTWVRLGTEY